MRLVGLAIVRNEEDILEASIRHNLRALDAIAVVDHGSDDATPAIVDALVAEGLPVDRVRDEALEFRPAALRDAHAARLLAAGADVVVPVDADEFLRIASRSEFERAVRAAGAGVPLAIPSTIHALPFAGESGSEAAIAARLLRARRRDDGRPAERKFVVHGGAAEARDGRATPRDLDAAVASIAHVPIRGAAQFIGKVAVGHLARLLAGDAPGGPWAEVYPAILAGHRYNDDELLAILSNYGAGTDRREPATVRWVDAPIDIGATLRVTPDAVGRPLARILGFGERVAAEIARATGGL